MWKHPRTTIAGILMILGAVCDVGNALLAGHAPQWTADGAALVTGIGLIFASDAANMVAK